MRVLVLVLCSACLIPSHRGLTGERKRVWTQPGSPKVFSWVSTVEQRTTKVLSSKSPSLLEAKESATIVRTTIYAIDPATRAEVRLGTVDGDGGDGVYYDAPRGVLWVRDRENQLSGLGGGNAVGPAHGRRQIVVAGIAPPLVLATTAETGALALIDLATDRQVLVPETVASAEVSVARSVVRFTSLASAGEAVRVQQVAVAVSPGGPRRLADTAGSTAALSPAEGMRLAQTMLRDGRYAEVIRSPSGTRLVVYDLLAAPSARPIIMTLPSPAPDDDAPIAHLVATGDDAVAFGEAGTTGDRACWRGATVRVNRMLVVPLHPSTCVIEGTTAGTDRLLKTRDGLVAVIDAEAQLVPLADVDPRSLTEGFATSPTRRAFTRGDARTGLALVDVDVVTGEQTRQAVRIQPGDRLLSLDNGIARFARGPDTLVTLPLANPASTATLVLAAPSLSRRDRMPRDRTEFWIGGGGGAGTRGMGVGRLALEIAHWLNDRWTMVWRANARVEAKGGKTDPEYVDAGASFGYAWHRLPRLWSLGFEANVGANFAGTYIEQERTDTAFAPSAEVRVGAQGRMFGLDLGVLMPSMIEPDRGVLFMLNVKFGFTENLD